MILTIWVPVFAVLLRLANMNTPLLIKIFTIDSINEHFHIVFSVLANVYQSSYRMNTYMFLMNCVALEQGLKPFVINETRIKFKKHWFVGLTPLFF